jgi:CubicO group peptidase (beta-lactamase class C family)
MGAEFEANITVDRCGASRAAGGISTTLRDLARLGLTMQQHGIAQGRNVLPAWWVHETSTGGDPEAWAKGNFQHLLPGGNYCNKWYQYGNDLGAYCGIGIHGQFLYVAPTASVVIAHFGSHPEPFNALAETVLLDAFDSIARACVR